MSKYSFVRGAGTVEGTGASAPLVESGRKMARTQGLTRPPEVPAGDKVRSQRRCWVWEKNVVYSPSCFVRGGARFWGLVFRAFWRASWKIGEEASCRKPRHDREKSFANLQRVSPGWPVLYVEEQRCACIARACNHQRDRDCRGQPFLCARCQPGCYAVGVRVRSRAKVSRSGSGFSGVSQQRGALPVLYV